MKRKARALTRTTKQVGTSDMRRDLQLKALAPGKRRSKSGNIYYEYRKNRSDVRGRDTPKNYRGKKTLPTFSHLNKSDLLKKYKANEEKNLHTKNAVMLIGIFGTPAQKTKALSIARAVTKRGYVTKEESDWLYKYGHSHYRKLLPGKTMVKTSPKVKTTMSVGSREPLRGVRKHDLLPLAVRRKLPKLYSQDGKKNPTVYLKLFSPYSSYTLYVTEFDGKDTLYGYAKTYAGGSEWGYSSFKELVSANRNGLPLIERDMYFTPKPISKISDIPMRK